MGHCYILLVTLLLGKKWDGFIKFLDGRRALHSVLGGYYLAPVMLWIGRCDLRDGESVGVRSSLNSRRLARKSGSFSSGTLLRRALLLVKIIRAKFHIFHFDFPLGQKGVGFGSFAKTISQRGPCNCSLGSSPRPLGMCMGRDPDLFFPLVNP